MCHVMSVSCVDAATEQKIVFPLAIHLFCFFINHYEDSTFSLCFASLFPFFFVHYIYSIETIFATTTSVGHNKLFPSLLNRVSFPRTIMFYSIYMFYFHCSFTSLYQPIQNYLEIGFQNRVCGLILRGIEKNTLFKYICQVETHCITNSHYDVHLNIKMIFRS